MAYPVLSQPRNWASESIDLATHSSPADLSTLTSKGVEYHIEEALPSSELESFSLDTSPSPLSKKNRKRTNRNQLESSAKKAKTVVKPKAKPSATNDNAILDELFITLAPHHKENAIANAKLLLEISNLRPVRLKGVFRCAKKKLQKFSEMTKADIDVVAAHHLSEILAMHSGKGMATALAVTGFFKSKYLQNKDKQLCLIQLSVVTSMSSQKGFPSESQLQAFFESPYLKNVNGELCPKRLSLVSSVYSRKGFPSKDQLKAFFESPYLKNLNEKLCPKRLSIVRTVCRAKGFPLEGQLKTFFESPYLTSANGELCPKRLSLVSNACHQKGLPSKDKLKAFFESPYLKNANEELCSKRLSLVSSIYIGKGFPSESQLQAFFESPYLTSANGELCSKRLSLVSSVCSRKGFPSKDQLKAFFESQYLKNANGDLCPKRLSLVSSLCSRKGFPLGNKLKAFFESPYLTSANGELCPKRLSFVSNICIGKGFPLGDKLKAFFESQYLTSANGELCSKRLSLVSSVCCQKGFPSEDKLKAFFESQYLKSANGELCSKRLSLVSSVCCQKGFPSEDKLKAFFESQYLKSANGGLCPKRLSLVSITCCKKGFPSEGQLKTFFESQYLKNANGELCPKRHSLVSRVCCKKGFPSEPQLRAFFESQYLKNANGDLCPKRLSLVSSLCSRKGFPLGDKLKAFFESPYLTSANGELCPKRLSLVSRVCCQKGFPSEDKLKAFFESQYLKNANGELCPKRLSLVSSVCCKKGFPSEGQLKTFFESQHLKNERGELCPKRLSLVSRVCYEKGLPSKDKLKTFFESQYLKNERGELCLNRLYLVSSVCCQKGFPTDMQLNVFFGNLYFLNTPTHLRPSLSISLARIQNSKGLPNKSSLEDFARLLPNNKEAASDLLSTLDKKYFRKGINAVIPLLQRVQATSEYQHLHSQLADNDEELGNLDFFVAFTHLWLVTSDDAALQKKVNACCPLEAYEGVKLFVVSHHGIIKKLSRIARIKGCSGLKFLFDYFKDPKIAPPKLLLQQLLSADISLLVIKSSYDVEPNDEALRSKYIDFCNAADYQPVKAQWERLIKPNLLQFLECYVDRKTPAYIFASCLPYINDAMLSQFIKPSSQQALHYTFYSYGLIKSLTQLDKERFSQACQAAIDYGLYGLGESTHWRPTPEMLSALLYALADMGLSLRIASKHQSIVEGTTLSAASTQSSISVTLTGNNTSESTDLLLCFTYHFSFALSDAPFGFKINENAIIVYDEHGGNVKFTWPVITVTPTGITIGNWSSETFIHFMALTSHDIASHADYHPELPPPQYIAARALRLEQNKGKERQKSTLSPIAVSRLPIEPDNAVEFMELTEVSGDTDEPMDTFDGVAQSISDIPGYGEDADWLNEGSEPMFDEFFLTPDGGLASLVADDAGAAIADDFFDSQEGDDDMDAIFNDDTFLPFEDDEPVDRWLNGDALLPFADSELVDAGQWFLSEQNATDEEQVLSLLLAKTLLLPNDFEQLEKIKDTLTVMQMQSVLSKADFSVPESIIVNWELAVASKKIRQFIANDT